jgi:ATPase subunit of ABC transporter with duplicated ATPase domains
MISFSNINKQYGKQLLFADASFQLNPGEKVGPVGPNGAGKTTLFRMVVGEETPDEGAVSVPKKLTIGYFRQDVEEMQGRSVEIPSERNLLVSNRGACACMARRPEL